MSQQLFSAGIGVELLSADFTARAHILTGSGAPGGDSNKQDAAPIGSLYLRQDAETDGLQIYFKNSVANNSAVDWAQATDKAYVDAIAMGLSWREPVRVLDATTYANIAALPVGGTIDGVTLVDGDRVLFTDITGDNVNVYIWDAGGTSWSEDTNLATDGDGLLVQEGTSAEQQWVFDGTNWVQFSSAASNSELGFIRTFIGKSAVGSELPTYSSTFVVSNGTSLQTAIGALDTSIGDRAYTNDFVVTDGQSLTASIDALDAVIGNRDYTDGLVLTDGQNLTASLEALNVAVGDRAYTNDFVVTDGESLTASIDALDSAVGDRVYTEDNVVTDGQTFTASINALDVAVGALQSSTSITVNVANVTTATVIDSVPLADADNVEWSIVAENTGNATNRQSTILNAIHDGTDVDFSTYANNRRGAPISGFNVSVVVNGANLELIVSSTTAVDVGAKRRVSLVAN